MPEVINTNELIIHSAEDIVFSHTELITEECQDFPAFEVKSVMPIDKNIEKPTLQESINANDLIINSVKTIVCNQTNLSIKECQDFPTFEVKSLMSIDKNLEKPNIQEITKANEPIIHSAEAISLNQTAEIIEQCQDLPSFETTAIMPKYCIFEEKTVPEFKCVTKPISIKKIPLIKKINDNKKRNKFTNSIVEITPSTISKINPNSNYDKIIFEKANIKFYDKIKNSKQDSQNTVNSKSFHSNLRTKTTYESNTNFDNYYHCRYNNNRINNRKRDFKTNDQNEDQSNRIFSLNRAKNWKKRRKA